ncbi:cation transporter [Rhodanobacter lindaniclasticus]
MLGLGVLLGVVWRLVMGSHPEGVWMMGIAFVALVVNATVLRLLERFRHGEVHLRATSRRFTRVDVIANLAVIVSGVLVLLLHSAGPDLVMVRPSRATCWKEALGILREAKEARVAASVWILKP